MKTIIKILRGCDDSMELLACVIGIVFGYAFIAAIFFNFHWMCGMMSFYLTTSLLKAAQIVVDWLEKHNNDEIKD